MKYETEDGKEFQFGYETARVKCPRCKNWKSIASVVMDMSTSREKSPEKECDCGNKFQIGFVGV